MNQVVTSAKEKAEALSRQYSSVFTMEDTSSLPSKGPSPFPTMPDITITVAGVEKLLASLNPRKASGPDQVPTRILKEHASTLAPVLQIIFQQSLDTGDIPEDWRQANVTAVFKKGDRTQPANYRPVSLTCIACKVLEHIISSNIRAHLDQHNILNDFQHGFRKHHSCETQLIATLEDLSSGIDQKQQIDCLILDFSKAFDVVAHRRLIYKLGWYGIQGTTNTWIESWLTSRTQAVVIDGERSTDATVDSGVPQGTVLGPPLFILYINDISDNISSSIKLFADDCLLYRQINTKEDAALLQKDLDILTQWSSDWQMKFNPAKCSLLRITNKRKHIVKSIYNMMGTDLQQVEHHPYLGVELSSKLDWGPHINNITGKARKSLNFLQRNLHKCPENIKQQAYTSLVRPVLEYSCTAWDPYLKKHISALESVQKKAARFVKGNYQRKASVSNMLQELNWPSLQDRRTAARLTMLYKINSGDLPLSIPEKFISVGDIPDRAGTRSQRPNQYINYGARTMTHKYSFYPRTITQWNILPASIIHESTSTKSFNTKVRSYIQTNSAQLYTGEPEDPNPASSN